MKRVFTGLAAMTVVLAGCSSKDHFGKPPTLSPINNTPEHSAMMSR